MRLIVAFAALLITLPLHAQDPGTAIAAGRQAINARDYALAVKRLQDAIPGAAGLAEPQRAQALGALHFYTAIAFSAMKNDAKAREELEQFFTFSPNMNTIDPAKFDKRFVATFKEVRAALDAQPSANFASNYPGYLKFSEAVPGERPLEQFGEGPEMTLLGTTDEKRDWKVVADDVARRRFIKEFWQRRDPAFRAEFERRVAFADETFVTEHVRGALTDRGRVFVLLGPPKIVRQSNLTAAEAARGVPPSARNRSVANPSSSGAGDLQAGAAAADLASRRLGQVDTTMVAKGKVEKWLYGRDQLPKSFPDDQLIVRFVTEEGYGENVMQREPLVLKALHDAGHSSR